MKRSDYKKAINHLVKYHLNHKDYIAAFEYGSYKNPGLSDIDLIIIIKDKKIQNLKQKIFDIKNDVKLKFFFEYSNIMITSKRFIRNIILFDDLRLKQIFGTKILINNFNKYKQELKLLSILEWLPERIIRLKENLENFNQINLRKHLGLLNSLKYTLIKINEIIFIKKLKSYIDKIENLRKRKTPLLYKNAIKQFSIKIYKYLIKLFDSLNFKNFYLNELNQIKMSGSLKINFPSKYFIAFTASNTAISKKKGINFPFIFSLPHIFHLLQKNKFQRIISRFMIYEKLKLQIKNKKYMFILKKRNALILENFELLSKNKINNGIYKYGWFLNYEK